MPLFCVVFVSMCANLKTILMREGLEGRVWRALELFIHSVAKTLLPPLRKVVWRHTIAAPAPASLVVWGPENCPPPAPPRQKGWAPPWWCRRTRWRCLFLTQPLIYRGRWGSRTPWSWGERVGQTKSTESVNKHFLSEMQVSKHNLHLTPFLLRLHGLHMTTRWSNIL